MPNPPIEIVIGSAAVLHRRFRDVVVEQAAGASAMGRRFSLAVPGGSVVSQLLPSLDDALIDWSRSDIFWCDERAVRPSDADSNFRASMDGWLGGLADTGVRVHRLRAEHAPLAAAARRAEAELREVLGASLTLDLLVVGVGEDGHICSLFPDHRALDEATRAIVPIDDAPKPPPRRLTMSLPLVMRARTLVVAAYGASKREVMRSALNDSASRLPVALALRGSPRGVVLLDSEAGHSLP